jgi:hypothetical protein
MWPLLACVFVSTMSKARVPNVSFHDFKVYQRGPIARKTFPRPNQVAWTVWFGLQSNLYDQSSRSAR